MPCFVLIVGHLPGPNPRVNIIKWLGKIFLISSSVILTSVFNVIATIKGDNIWFQNVLLFHDKFYFYKITIYVNAKLTTVWK